MVSPLLMNKTVGIAKSPHTSVHYYNTLASNFDGLRSNRKGFVTARTAGLPAPFIGSGLAWAALSRVLWAAVSGV
jgi:hypothetical protein